MALFNKTISAILPFIPRTFAKPFASRYVAGVTVDEALNVMSVKDGEVSWATQDTSVSSSHSLTIDTTASVLAGTYQGKRV